MGLAVELGALQAAAFGQGLAGDGVDQRAEGRDLDDFLLAPAVEGHVHDLEAPPDDARAPEQRLHLVGRGVGRDVEILGLDAEQQVAHRAAHDVGLVAGLLQRGGDLDGIARQQRGVDLVFVGADNARRMGMAGAAQLGAGFAQQPGN
ncbi:hypothetical protein D9M68_377640 [compost metagenome]